MEPNDVRPVGGVLSPHLTVETKASSKRQTRGSQFATNARLGRRDLLTPSPSAQ